jgi:hypothetical protein
VKFCTDPEHVGANPLPASEFNKHRGRRDGLNSWCRACDHRRNARFRVAHPGWDQGRQRQPEPVKNRAKSHRQRRELRDAVLDHYGRACACCGSAENLSVDHVNGGGGAHRTELFGRRSVQSTMMYRWLAAQGFPEGYQVLCMPCNSSKQEGLACRLDHGEEPAA